MASSSQILANRENAQHSTGPKSDEGKARVAQNRITHGLAGRRVLLPGEEPAALNTLLMRYHLELVPGNIVESHLVDTIAHHQFRLNRVVEWEAGLMTEALEGDPAQPSRLCLMFARSGDPAEALAKLQRYEAQLRRQHQNALKEFRLQKSARHKANTVEAATTRQDINNLSEKCRRIFDNLEINHSNPISPRQPAVPTPAGPADSAAVLPPASEEAV